MPCVCSPGPGHLPPAAPPRALASLATMSSLRQTPLTCSGHTRPVVFLAFSEISPEGQYYSISACKDGRSDSYTRITQINSQRNVK